MVAWPVRPRLRSPWSSLLEIAQSFPEAVSSWLGRNRRSFLLFFSLVYLIGNGVIASRRYMWADEVVTAYMNRLSLPSLWPALASGADLEPPLFHLITRAFAGVLGPTPLALRMPAIIGGWLLCVSLYLFASRRFQPLYAVIAMLIPFVTEAAPYTYNARSYGIALGFSGIALVCWQGAAERGWRRLCLITLAVSLAAAIACQYYMVLVFLAIAAGEAARSYTKKRIDFAIWAALAASLLPLPFHMPLIRAAMTFTGGAWSVANSSALLAAYQRFLERAILPVVLVVTGLAIFSRLESKAAVPPENSRKGELPPWEMIAAGFLAFSLAGAYLVARLTNGIFTPRYGLCLVLGAAILPLPVIRLCDTARPLAGVLAFLVLLGSFAGSFLQQQLGRRDRFNTPQLLLTAKDPAIVIENPLDFMELIYNAPPPLVSRLYYLPSRENSVRYTGTDDDERELLLLRRWFPMRLEAPDAFLKHHKRILIWRGRRPGWILRKLADGGATITLAGALPGEWLFSAAPGWDGL